MSACNHDSIARKTAYGNAIQQVRQAQAHNILGSLFTTLTKPPSKGSRWVQQKDGGWGSKMSMVSSQNVLLEDWVIDGCRPALEIYGDVLEFHSKELGLFGGTHTQKYSNAAFRRKESPGAKENDA